MLIKTRRVVEEGEGAALLAAYSMKQARVTGVLLRQ